MGGAVTSDWGCYACLRFDAAERPAIEGRADWPDHALGKGCKCVEVVSDEDREAIDRARDVMREWREAKR